ncbi:MAG: hypothetical protein ACRC3K_12395, partial [Plesiomonas sp.]
PTFDIPVNYVKHVVSVVPAVDNTYILNVIADRQSSLAVWVCDPATGIPVKRLAAQVICGTNAGKHAPIQITALNEPGCDSSYFEHIGFNIPKAVVTAYKSATDKITLALVSAFGNTNGTSIFINGYSMAETKFPYSSSNGNALNQRINGGSNTGLTHTLLTDGMASVTIANGASIDYVRVPLVDLDRDVYLTLVGTSALHGSSVSNADTTIVSPLGRLPLYRPKPTLKAPIGVLTVIDIGGGHDMGGWVITSQQLKKFAVTPINSGVPYLQLAIKNSSTADNIIISAIITEVVA